MRDRRLRRHFLRYREQGDYEALALVFDEAAPALLGLAVHLVRPAHGAEDLVQTTFLTAIERAPRWDSARPLYPWLAGILIHKARRWNAAEARPLDPTRLHERSGETDPAHVADHLELGASLRRALSDLPHLYRVVLEPWFERGASPAQLADELGVAPGTVRVRLHRGLERLRRVLPPGLAFGAAAIGLPKPSLAAVREVVSAAARAKAAPLVTGGAGSLTMLTLLPTMPALTLSLAAGAAATFQVATRYPGTVPPVPAEAKYTSGAHATSPAPAPGTPGAPEEEATPGERARRPAPSTAELTGLSVWVGTSVQEIEALVANEPEARALVRTLDGETPQTRVEVAPFRLGLTEVTQEQYAAFVRATGHRPPLDWAGEAIEAGRQAFLEELEVLRTQGRPSQATTYDADGWWEKNWRGQAWAVPDGDELRPVVNVSYDDAVAYTRWAGLRLPTEQEYQRAVRGGGHAPYPWGDAWQDGNAATSELQRISRSHPVGSFPDGASTDGVLDLAGNVWEWTASPYVALPGFGKNEYRVPGQRARVSVPTPRWDPLQRVVVGGSYQNSRMAARCTVRRGAERAQRTNALGFRVASTPQRGYDAATAALSLVSEGPGYDPTRVLALDRWHTLPTSDAVEGYAVIGGYDHLVFVPVAALGETQGSALARASTHVGLISTSLPLASPPVGPGAYQLVLEFEPEPETWLVRWLDARTGADVATSALEAHPFGKDDGAHGLSRDGDRVVIDARVATRIRRRVLPLRLELEAAARALDGPWE